MSPQEETFEISIHLGNAIIQYLGKQPYVETAELINQLQMSANESANKKNAPAEEKE